MSQIQTRLVPLLKVSPLVVLRPMQNVPQIHLPMLLPAWAVPPVEKVV
jgi:hypothetical protein